MNITSVESVRRLNRNTVPVVPGTVSGDYQVIDGSDRVDAVARVVVDVAVCDHGRRGGAKRAGSRPIDAPTVVADEVTVFHLHLADGDLIRGADKAGTGVGVVGEIAVDGQQTIGADGSSTKGTS